MCNVFSPLQVALIQSGNTSGKESLEEPCSSMIYSVTDRQHLNGMLVSHVTLMVILGKAESI